MAKIDIDDLAKTVIMELNAYGEKAVEAVDKAVKETAKETVQMLKVTSPEDTKEYAKHWAYGRNKGKTGTRGNMLVYSKDPEYRLTHLLEYGHAKVNGGRVKGQPHIKFARETAKRRLRNKIKKELG